MPPCGRNRRGRCRTRIVHSYRCMMRLRRGKNCLGPRGFVKKSAMLSAVATKGTTICRFSAVSSRVLPGNFGGYLRRCHSDAYQVPYTPSRNEVVAERTGHTDRGAQTQCLIRRIHSRTVGWLGTSSRRVLIEREREKPHACRPGGVSQTLTDVMTDPWSA